MRDDFPRTSHHPLSPEQRAVLAAANSDDGAAAPLNVLRIGVGGVVDVERLRSAVEAVCGAHCVLCSEIREAAGFKGFRQFYSEAAFALRWNEFAIGDTGEETSAHAGPPDRSRSASVLLERGEAIGAALVERSNARYELVLHSSALVADQGSMWILADQIAAAYLDGATNVVPPFRYSQYQAWREELAGAEEAERGQAYWAAYASKAAALAAPRLAHRGFRNDMEESGRIEVARSIAPSLARRIGAAADSEGWAPETMFQAAWWLLLSKATRAARFVGGWSHDCRRDYDVMRGAVGVFEKVLPVIADLEGEPTFAEWVARLEEMSRAHVDAQEYLSLEASPLSAHSEIGYSFHETAQSMDRTEWSASLRPAWFPRFELDLCVRWANESGDFVIRADAARYSRRAIEHLASQLAVLMQNALARPTIVVSELGVIGMEERGTLLAMEGPCADFGGGTVADRVADWAARTPEAPAVEFEELCISYKELDRRVERLARRLRREGLCAADLVALEVPRSAELVVAILAVWRVGAAYLPLEPDWPAERRAALLADARPALILRATAQEGASRSEWREVVLADAVPEAPGGVEPMRRAVAPSELAYVLYTSGSTGAPKGVAVEHRHLFNYVAAATEAMQLASRRRWGLTSSVAADLGNTSLFGALFNGACLVVADADDAKNPAAFARFIVDRRIDALKMAPSHLDALLDVHLPSLPETLVLGGEPAPRSLIERIRRIAPACRIYNHYGPTETTVGVVVHRVPADRPIPEMQPLTRVLANNRLRILDEGGELTPIGGIGELYVGGAQICRGYTNRHGDDAFVRDPFAPDERLYRTGDLAAVLPEGGILWVGRADQQIKIRGFRIDPAEVEAALLTAPGVKHAVVLAVRRVETAELAACLVAHSGTTPDAATTQARERLSKSLPQHMVPSRWIIMEEFPRLPNGKLDRLALMAVALQDPREGERRVPRDGLEALLAHGVGALLGRPPLGVDESFFEAGVHSLIVIRLVARMRKILGIEVAPGLVFDHPTVAELAAALRAGPWDASRFEELAEAALPSISSAVSRGQAVESVA
jgi:amino acid adenylation domain-containing protein